MKKSSRRGGKRSSPEDLVRPIFEQLRYACGALLFPSEIVIM